MHLEQMSYSYLFTHSTWCAMHYCTITANLLTLKATVTDKYGGRYKQVRMSFHQRLWHTQTDGPLNHDPIKRIKPEDHLQARLWKQVLDKHRGFTNKKALEDAAKM